MLATDQRSLFLEALYPPAGYTFDYGLGTTFTLDLLTLLMTPLALTFRDTTDVETLVTDPVLFLESLQRFAERLTLFCQAGRIGIPRQDSLLYRFLEPLVVEVQAPRGGVFHPKVWILRYVAEDRPTLYRLLNLSRNLTFDKSWDLMLRLEGEVQERAYGYGRNKPLGDFVAALPKLAIQPLQPHIQNKIVELEHELRRVDFQVPEGFAQTSLEFHPSGINGYNRGYCFAEDVRRALIISPFLTAGILRQITTTGSDHVVISRPDSLAMLPSGTISPQTKCFVLDEADMDIMDEEMPASTEDATVHTDAVVQNGLHAKLFILETGGEARWLQGSANATDAACNGHNVEFMIALKGRRSKIGIDQVLGADDAVSALRMLLKPYTLPETARSPDSLAAEKLADNIRRCLINASLQLYVEKEYDIVLRGDQITPPHKGSINVYCWPISLPESRAERMLLGSALWIRFEALSLEALTPFMAFRVEAQAPDGSRHTLRFALKLPIIGLPEDREAHLISAIVSNREKFLRYLWLILADDRMELPAWLQMAADGTSRHMQHYSHEMPLLESLVRALSRSPDKIDRIAELVTRLQGTPEGHTVLPEGFEPLWEAITQIRSKQR